MVGREIIHRHVMREDKIDRHKPVLQVRKLCHKKYFKDISFDLFAGEIVGMAGLIGAGRSEIARTLFGLERKASGEILLDGQSIDPRSPTEALACGLAYTSENRKLDGLFLDMSISENSIAPQLKKFSSHTLDFLDKTRIAGFVKENMGRFAIRASSAEAKLRKLSGGNQQKVLLSMWLGIGPKVLIVDEPTKGVDVGAKNEILDILRQIADSGIPIMVISSDLLEILALCDRVLVLKEGRVRGELNHAEATEEKIIAYASGIV
jgi:ABC-type sugar transport system ATPase subunit